MLRGAERGVNRLRLGTTAREGTVLAAVIVPDPPGPLPFVPLRETLYTQDELTGVTADGRRLDEAIGDWFHDGGHGVDFARARALHDAGIDIALARHLLGRSVVGVMGGHADERGSDRYTAIAHLGRELTRAGFHVATGGGPGLMEAANLGAWLAPAADADLGVALAMLDAAPSYDADHTAYVDVAGAVRDRWPHGGESLGVPTWVYADEPTSAFCTHIAKYFTNSIREDGLLALARSGVVYAPGGAGTAQEIFTDAAQNTNTLYEVRSPMVFFDRVFHEHEQPELLRAVERQARRFGWAELVTVLDDVDAVVDFVERHDPDGVGTSVTRRRRRPDRP
jgi:predicted Rossmann-fold nucleotide-binding protein